MLHSLEPAPHLLTHVPLGHQDIAWLHLTAWLLKPPVLTFSSGVLEVLLHS